MLCPVQDGSGDGEEVADRIVISIRPGRVSVTLARSGQLMRFRGRNHSTSFIIKGVCLTGIEGLVPKLGTYFMDIKRRHSTFLRCLSLKGGCGSCAGCLGRMEDSGGGLCPVSGTAGRPSLRGRNDMRAVLRRNRRVLMRVMGRPVSAGKPHLAYRVSFPKHFLMLVPFRSGISMSSGVGSTRRHTHLGRLVRDVGPGGFNIVIHAITRKGHITRLSARLGILLGEYRRAFVGMRGTATLPAVIFRRADHAMTVLHSLFGPSCRGVCVGSASVCGRMGSCIALVTPRDINVMGRCANGLPVFSGFSVAGRVGSSFKGAMSCGRNTCLVVRRARTLRIISMGDKGHSGSGSNRRTGTLSIGLKTTSRLTHRLELHSVNNVVIISFVSVGLTRSQRGLCRQVYRGVGGSETHRGVLPLDGFNLVRVAHRHMHPIVSIAMSRIYPAYFNGKAIGSDFLFASMLRDGVSAVSGGLSVGGFALRIRPCITTCVGRNFVSLGHG